MSDLEKVLINLPNHIIELEHDYKKALENISNYKLGSSAYYVAIKQAADVKKQVILNKDLAKSYGVDYGLQARAMGASTKSYQ